MKHKISLIIALVYSVCITAALYFLDSDKPYDNIWANIIEFLAVTLIIFLVICIIYFAVYLVIRLMTKKNAI